MFVVLDLMIMELKSSWHASDAGESSNTSNGIPRVSLLLGKLMLKAVTYICCTSCAIATGEAEDMTRVYMWTILRKLCHAAYKAPLPTKSEHQKVKEMAGAPEVTEATNEHIEMRSGREVVDMRPEMESMFARMEMNKSNRGSTQVRLS